MFMGGGMSFLDDDIGGVSIQVGDHGSQSSAAIYSESNS
jgi:hypothetical protein